MLREIDVLRKYLPRDNRTSNQEGVVHVRRNKSQGQAVIQTQQSIVEGLTQLFNIAEESTVPVLPQTPPTETKPFNMYKGWVRCPEADHPRLKGTIGGNPANEPAHIPQTTAFLSPGGAVIYMSSSRALELGLIDDFDESTIPLSEHSISVVEKHTTEQSETK